MVAVLGSVPMLRRALWQTIFQRFDPYTPPAATAWRADRPLSPTKLIVDELDLELETAHILFTGTTGTGKTTELLRVAEARMQKEFVVYFDLDRHFEQIVGDPAALQNVSPWEVCFLAGVALLRAAEERLGFELPSAHRTDIEQAWTRLAKSSGAEDAPPQIDIGKLAKSMMLVVAAASAAAGPVGSTVATGLSLLAPIPEAGKWSLKVGLKKKVALSDQDTDVQSLLKCVNTLIGLIQARGNRVLLILDGLDRVETFDRAKELFLDSHMLGQLDCHLVLCGPFVLRRYGALAHWRGLVPPLVNVPVLLQEDPMRPGPGIPFFHEIFARRVADLAGGSDLVPRLLLDRLAYYSGGRAREFVHFIRRLARNAILAGADSANDEIVERVVHERRITRETGLHLGHIGLLESIAADPLHRLPDDKLVNELLTYGALLPYPDTSEWYYPHPLLTMNLVRAKPVGSSR